MSHPAATFWNRGVHRVPVTTGAAALLDASDIPDLCERLELGPFGSVLDVGCGTGRIAKYCTSYVGVDIAQDAVTYCQQKGIDARVIASPADLPDGTFDWVICMSVFTHVGRSERQQYLAAFKARASRLLVDIIPGQEDGDWALWRANPVDFEADMASAGYRIVAVAHRPSPEGVPHTYYHAECM